MYSKEELDEEFEKLSEYELSVLKKRREQAHLRVANIPSDIKDLLLSTNGSITWVDLATRIGNDVSASAVRDYVMGLDGFSYVSVGTEV